MPFTLSTLISRRANRYPSRSSTSPGSQRKLYFPPGGHTYDRHTIPPDRLHISFSDPVLVAAEQRLSSVSDKLLIIKDAGATKTVKHGSLVFHLKTDGILSQTSGDYNDNPLICEAVNPLATVHTPGTRHGHCWKAGFQGTAAHLLDPPYDPCDIPEVVTIFNTNDGSPGNADSSACENSRHGSDLAPLASEIFKEELYIRGYLKRPTSRPSNAVPRKPRTSLMVVRRKVFQKVLGRHQGRKVAECLRVGQGIAETAGGPDAPFAEKESSTSVASVTLRTPHADLDGLESPGVDTDTSASESFDLHEFSYLTAFTTPPSSPSTILDPETFKTGVDLADSKHAV